MADRRALIDGLKTPAPPVDPDKEKAFVFQDKAGSATETNTAPTKASIPSSGNALARVPLSTRMRADFSAALKRASLERQLAGIEPNTLQDILEESVEPWLRNNGYIK